MLRHRSIMIAAIVAAGCLHARAQAQVISTWTNDGGDSSWTNPENWDHNVPAADGNYPDNGQGGFNYSVVIDVAANAMLGDSIELDSLSLMGVNRFISGGGQISVNGVSTFQGVAGFSGGAGMFLPQGEVVVPNGTFQISGWDMIVGSTLQLGDQDTPANMAMLSGAEVTINGSLTISSGSISGAVDSKLLINGLFKMTEPDGEPGTGVNAPVHVISGTIFNQSFDTLTFGNVFDLDESDPDVVLNNATIIPQSGVIAFDAAKVSITNGLSVASITDGIIEFKQSEVLLNGSITGSSVVELKGFSTLDGGTLAVTLGALSTGSFVHHGGQIKTTTNSANYRWRSGFIEGGTFTNSGSARAVDFDGFRLVRFGTLDNQSSFIHEDGTITLGENGTINNSGNWTVTSGTTINRQTPGDASVTFNNTGTFTKTNSNDFDTTIDVFFNNAGTVICNSDVLTFRPDVVLQLDEDTGELTGGTWTVSGDGSIVFQGLQEDLTLATNGTITVDGENAVFTPLETLTKNNGKVEITGGANQTITPTDGELSNEALAELFIVAADIEVNGTFINNSTTRLEGGTQFTVNGDAMNAGVCTFSEDSTTTVGGNFTNQSGGTWQAGGTMNAVVVTNDGDLRIGDTPGSPGIDDIFLFVDSFGSGDTSVWVLSIDELAGLTSGGIMSDSMTISGSATLDGALEVDMLNGFMPQIGDSFTILTAASITGAFSTLALPALAEGEWAIEYETTAVTLSIVEAGAGPADLDNDGDVDVMDLLDLLSAFGTDGDGADIALPNNVVDVFDLLGLFDNWG